MEQVWRSVPHCCNALAMTATRYDTLDERTLQRWVARTVADDVLAVAAASAWHAPRLRAV